MDSSLKKARHGLLGDIRGLEFVQWGRDVRLSVRSNPEELPALYAVIPVHKLILCARSPVFQAMFTGAMEEAVKSEVVIEDCSLAAIKSVISFMYSGILTFACASHCVDVHTVADKYAVSDLVQLCEAYLLQKIQISDFTMGKEDFLVIWHAAKDKNLSSLEKACLAFLVKNGKLLKTWSYPSFLTHEQALKVIQYGMDNFSVVPPLYTSTRTDAYDPVTVVGDGHFDY